VPLAYRLLERIHDGSSCTVYRARSDGDGQVVVIKEFRERYPSVESLNRFRRERDLQAAAQGPGVPSVLGFEAADGVARLIMSDSGSRSLSSMYARRRPGLREALRVAMAVAAALERTHALGIVHKDITPSNIIVQPATFDVELIDFGIASLLPRHGAGPSPVERFEGTPLFMAPEQTGRMNRSIDCRTDLYSLGATLFALLCGRPPFESDDPAELVHAHIARNPPRPDALCADIPKPLSDLVMRLLAKRAEDRYQSAGGLKHDLARCLGRLDAGVALGELELGRFDLPLQLPVSQRLHGRERELRELEEAAQRVASGGSELFLVRGRPGIGKSSLVGEAERWIAARRGLFLTGKAESQERESPYAPVVGALRSLVQTVLALSQADIDAWRATVLDSVGRNGRVLTRMLPDFELVLGRQPELDAVTPAEAENRVREVLRRFVRALAGPSRPLALFIDDLQWADRPTLALLESLAADPDTPYVLLLGAYRDQDVDEAHPLTACLTTIRASGAKLNEVGLGPLGEAQIAPWLSEILRQPSELTAPLAALVARKTAGNPFFLARFLQTLAEDGLLRVDMAAGRWTWDLAAIDARGYTENVAEFLAGRLDALPDRTRGALSAAVCRGTSFELGLLAEALGVSRHALQGDLWPAIEHAIVVPTDDAYWFDASRPLPDDAIPDFRFRFAHDRVAQAVALRSDPAAAAATHLALGRLMLDRYTGAERSLRLFDIVDHLDRGASLLIDEADRLRFAEVAAEAGVRALGNAAYDSAHSLFGRAVSLCGEDAWTARYPQTLELHTHAAEAAYLSGDSDAMEARVSAIREHARGLLDRLRGEVVRINAHVVGNEQRTAVMLALDALDELGVLLPREPTDDDVNRAISQTLQSLQGLTASDLLALPELDDPAEATARDILVCISTAAYLAVPRLLPIIAAELVRSTADRGASRASPYGLVLFALVLTAGQNIDRAFPLGRAAVDLLKRWEGQARETRVRHVFNTHVRVFRDRIRDACEALEPVFETGVANGDLEFASWAAHNHCVFALYSGRPLGEVAAKFDRYGQAIRQYGQQAALSCHEPFVRLVATLRTETDDPTRLDGPGYDADEMMARLEASGYRGAAFLTATCRLIARYLFGDLAGAVSVAEASEGFQDGAAATLHIPTFAFYDGLAHLGLARSGDEASRAAHLARAVARREEVAPFAAFAPANHGHRLALLDAELMRARGEVLAAMEAYDRAVALARDQQMAGEEPLANELAARFHLDGGRVTVARAYAREALYGWQGWGASGKARHLSKEFTTLLGVGDRRGRARTRRSDSSTTSTSTGSVGEELDLAALLRVSQALSSEMRLDALLEQVMSALVQSAGATCGILVMEEGGELVVRASETADGERAVDPGVLLTQCRALPRSAIRFVARTGAVLVVPDAGADARFVAASGAEGGHPHSVLCAPIVHSGVRSAIIYLENNLASRAFTAASVRMVELLGSQAAISIENARLFEQSHDMVRSFARFVPSEFVRTLHRERVMDVGVGDAVTRDITVLFADLRGFTKLFEGLEVAVGFALLNRYLGRITPIIERGGGFVDKFVGDAVMALFPGETDGAVRAAVELTRAAREMSEAEQELLRGASLEVGTGLHAGPVMLGALGAADRIDLTAIGDTVNTASRLQGATTGFSAPVLLSGAVVERLREPERFQLRPFGAARVYGRREPIDVFEAYCAESDAAIAAKTATMPAFLAGLAAYRAGDFGTAVAQFNACLLAWPEDEPARVLQSRAAGALIGKRGPLLKGQLRLV
jgi:predicted ATPase/class 3 adenylate cyclase/tRNA A-37 threonylcarbamoyl transferase component Bud32